MVLLAGGFVLGCVSFFETARSDILFSLLQLVYISVSLYLFYLSGGLALFLSFPHLVDISDENSCFSTWISLWIILCISFRLFLRLLGFPCLFSACAVRFAQDFLRFTYIVSRWMRWVLNT